MKDEFLLLLLKKHKITQKPNGNKTTRSPRKENQCHFLNKYTTETRKKTKQMRGATSLQV